MQCRPACSQQYHPESLLRHFAEVDIDELNRRALEMPQVFTRKVQEDFLATILLEKQTAEPLRIYGQIPDEFKHWRYWQQKLLGTDA